jgi:predicted sulfurtransferase
VRGERQKERERYRESKLIGAIKIKNEGINLMVRARRMSTTGRRRKKAKREKIQVKSLQLHDDEDDDDDFYAL